jgi:hypothetical protein
MNGWLYGNSGMRTGMAETRQPRPKPEQHRSEEKWNSFMNRLTKLLPITHTTSTGMTSKHNWRKPQQN